MNGKDIELSRRRVLGGIATVGAASAAVGAGTYAAFSDTEESTDNTISAGSLTLDTVSGTEFSLGKLYPNESTSEIEITTDYLGSLSTPLLDWGIQTGNEAVPNGSGSFADQLNVDKASLSIEGVEVADYGGTDVALSGFTGIREAVVDSTSTPTLNEGNTVSLTLQFSLDDVGNEFQEASIDFGVAFKARQSSADPLQSVTVNSP
ncbi:SipW-cognate class signal peptide [Halomicrobium zhouii]|uniref:SipW-cognate class signal peptide n=1 Tax=Halomicrobium zhouii TaxID=767519 RepID=A0A1I6KPJ9_9EURY|nr:TasA family protein [Halomicrobium zhouii]SFR93124.1 SipW-cognate class signal peptide [Halomicrobium zhouii]